MLRAAIIFFVLGLIGLSFGAFGLAGLSIDIGKTLLGVFLILSVISLIGGVLTGNRRNDLL